MERTELKELSYSDFQQMLVKSVMDQIDNAADESPLLYFPLVHERVESFLLINWKEVFENCSSLTVEEWYQSSCYEKFYKDVLEDFNSKTLLADSVKADHKKRDSLEPLV